MAKRPRSDAVRRANETIRRGLIKIESLLKEPDLSPERESILRKAAEACRDAKKASDHYARTGDTFHGETYLFYIEQAKAYAAKHKALLLKEKSADGEDAN